MEKNNSLYWLRWSYAFHKNRSRLSFKERLQIKTGILKIDPGISTKIENMTEEELMQAMSHIKYPWWDKIASFFGI